MTTVVAVRKGGRVAMAADGQATMGKSVIGKSTVKKLSRINDGKVIVGFAGSTADCFKLREMLDKKVQQYGTKLLRACVELAAEWRSDKYLRHLEATLIVTDGADIYQVDGVGNVLDPEADVVAIGSGGLYAQVAATAILKHGKASLKAEDIAREAVLDFASAIDCFTNSNVIVDVIAPGEGGDADD